MVIDLTNEDMADLLTALLGTTATLEGRWDDLDDATRRELASLAYHRATALVGSVDFASSRS
jgi:hypothetical protein